MQCFTSKVNKAIFLRRKRAYSFQVLHRHRRPCGRSLRHSFIEPLLLLEKPLPLISLGHHSMNSRYRKISLSLHLTAMEADVTFNATLRVIAIPDTYTCYGLRIIWSVRSSCRRTIDSRCAKRVRSWAHIGDITGFSVRRRGRRRGLVIRRPQCTGARPRGGKSS